MNTIWYGTVRSRIVSTCHQFRGTVRAVLYGTLVRYRTTLHDTSVRYRTAPSNRTVHKCTAPFCINGQITVSISNNVHYSIRYRTVPYVLYGTLEVPNPQIDANQSVHHVTMPIHLNMVLYGTVKISFFDKLFILYRTVPYRTVPYCRWRYRTVRYGTVLSSYSIHILYRTVPYRTYPTEILYGCIL
jgi:hypothetical protein